MVAGDPRGGRPRKDQPFYHLLAENAETEYVAYVSEQNLLPDTSGEALRHAGIAEMFERDAAGAYRMRDRDHELRAGRVKALASALIVQPGPESVGNRSIVQAGSPQREGPDLAARPPCGPAPAAGR